MFKFFSFLHNKSISLINKLFKFKKYIIAYEIVGDKIKILDSSNEYRFVDNSFYNKVKLNEIIKEHKEEIDLKISYYENKKGEYEIILFINAFILVVLGFIFIFSFFIGDILFFILAFTIIGLYLLIYINYSSQILIFREEIKRLSNFYKKNIIK